MRIALVGAGSLGTIIGALLSKAGLDVSMVDASEENVSSLNSRGAHVTGHMELVAAVTAILPGEMAGVYDLIIYVTKSTFDEEALPAVIPHMGEDSILITLQNGVPEERVASFVGRERTLGCAVGWGATWQGPGVSELTTAPEKMTYDIGELDGSITNRLRGAKEVLDNAGEAILTENLEGIRWTKLMVNATMSGLSAALGCDYGAILDDDRALTAAVCIILEAINTAIASGVKMEPMQGVDPTLMLGIAGEDVENAKNVLRMVFEPHRNITASMLHDLERGLPCEVETLNGHLSRVSAEAGVATPVNDRVTDIIRSIQNGRTDYRFSNLEDIELPDISIYLQ